MAKKSKRPPARKQQRPQVRPQTQRSTLPLAGLSTSTEASSAVEPADDVAAAAAADEQQDYAATALPYSESDGPMPLPPVDESGAEQPPPPPATQRPQVAASTAVSERRRIGRIDPSAAAQRQATQRAKSGRQLSTAAMFEPLPPEDDAIPFDRVPYVPGDLRRVAVIALLMIVLVVVADIVINNVVK